MFRSWEPPRPSKVSKPTLAVVFIAGLMSLIQVSTVKEMQDLDIGATEKYGIPSTLLMEVAIGSVPSFK